MHGSTLTYRQIFLFWLPLAGTWLMMAVEGPYLAAIIARLDRPTENLAAFGVAFAFAIIIEAPVIVEDTGGSSSGILLPLILLALVAAAVAAD